jgi:hypothetical protein
LIDRTGVDTDTVMRLSRPGLLVGAVLALALAAPAGAAEILTRNATDIQLGVDNAGRALVTYRAGGRMWHAFVSGAINARQPSRAIPQVKFKIDYSGGRGQWRRFRSTCRAYDGPTLAWFVKGCKASDGSYWALQAWQRMLPNVGYVPWRHEQKVWELHISHWTGALAQLEVYQDWVYGGRFEEVFGRATYAGHAIHGYRTTHSGKPLDTYGRLLYLDTFDSQYGTGWSRENSFVVHNPSGMYCYGFYPYGSYGSYPNQRTEKLVGNGEKYRMTLSGPGVTPDVAWVGHGLEEYDATIPELASWEEQMTAKVREMAAEYGENQCGHH